MPDTNELIIIGAGPAGITAAVYASRKGIQTLVISQDIGGQAAWSSDIENYTGYQFITGPDLTAKFEEHLRAHDITVKDNERVISLAKDASGCIVKTDKGSYRSKTVIVASGKRSRELDVPGEKEFKNRGLTYCATCDGPLFSGKTVAVVGGGNSALDATLQLIKIARQIYLININAALGGDSIMRAKVMASDKVKIFNNSCIGAVLGDKLVTAVKLIREGKEELLAVEGVFVEAGLVPNSEFAISLSKNELNEIKVSSYNQTNIPGIFAAGDVTDVPEKQIIIAAGEGAKASLSVFSYLAKSE
jgi:alkyl hydroperoxide reductase subunit F